MEREREREKNMGKNGQESGRLRCFKELNNNNNNNKLDVIHSILPDLTGILFIDRIK